MICPHCGEQFTGQEMIDFEEGLKVKESNQRLLRDFVVSYGEEINKIRRLFLFLVVFVLATFFATIIAFAVSSVSELWLLGLTVVLFTLALKKSLGDDRHVEQLLENYKVIRSNT